jgi:hypothetical protein
MGDLAALASEATLSLSVSAERRRIGATHRDHLGAAIGSTLAAALAAVAKPRRATASIREWTPSFSRMLSMHA